jgi:C_GCAxxG_C_C family probable redox protein
MSFELEAKAAFAEHFNCAQSTFAPFAKRLGLDPDMAMKIATPFGGGMGHAGQVCGAVSGALMAIGLARGITAYDRDKKYACYALAEAFIERFQEAHGAVTCPGLLGLDIGAPEDLARAREQDLFHTRCPHFVGGAARIAAELLELEP